MFVIKTQEMPAEPRLGNERRVLVYRDDTLHVIVPWYEDKSEVFNHRNAALASLYKSSGSEAFTPHHILGAAPVPGYGFWVVAVEEGLDS